MGWPSRHSLLCPGPKAMSSPEVNHVPLEKKSCSLSCPCFPQPPQGLPQLFIFIWRGGCGSASVLGISTDFLCVDQVCFLTPLCCVATLLLLLLHLSQSLGFWWEIYIFLIKITPVLSSIALGLQEQQGLSCPSYPLSNIIAILCVLIFS